jgi:hypothetical protein
MLAATRIARLPLTARPTRRAACACFSEIENYLGGQRQLAPRPLLSASPWIASSARVGSGRAIAASARSGNTATSRSLRHPSNTSWISPARHQQHRPHLASGPLRDEFLASPAPSLPHSCVPRLTPPALLGSLAVPASSPCGVLMAEAQSPFNNSFWVVSQPTNEVKHGVDN